MTNEQSILPSEAMRHYEQIEEEHRLKRINSQIELLRTQELLMRFLPPPPATILDVGGAAGIHAFWLADKGYDEKKQAWLLKQVRQVEAEPHLLGTSTHVMTVAYKR